LATADAYDAMSNNHPYRSKLSCAGVEARLQQGKGVRWDSRVVEALLRCRNQVHQIRQHGVGESLNQALQVALRTGEGSRFVPVVLTARPGLAARPQPGGP
jgi:HD-GYP domain-containing protein (c-di-GMP phosphodiesterase class II)